MYRRVRRESVRPLAFGWEGVKSVKGMATVQFPAVYYRFGAIVGVALAMMLAVAPAGGQEKKAHGHADTRMTERHYAHLSPSYVADTIRASLASFSAGGEQSSIVNLAARRTDI